MREKPAPTQPSTTRKGSSVSSQRTFEQKLTDFQEEFPHVHLGGPVVYYIRRGQHIKIGKTTNFHWRMQTLNGGCITPPGFDDIELLAVEKDNQFRDKEAARHRQLDHLKAGGEWFYEAPELLDLITALRGTRTEAENEWPHEVEVRKPSAPRGMFGREIGYESELTRRMKVTLEAEADGAMSLDDQRRAMEQASRYLSVP